jgi:toxin ParE1/3/4
MKPIRYLEAAEDEYLHELRYFTAISQQTGDPFYSAVLRAENFASEFSGMGAPYKFGTRRVFPGDFKFSIVYLTRPDEIVVVALAAFKRKPGYWRSRIKLA